MSTSSVNKSRKDILVYREKYFVPNTFVERPDPKGLSAIVSAPNSCHTGDPNSCPPDLELGALTKWLASQFKSECLGRLFYTLIDDF